MGEQGEQGKDGPKVGVSVPLIECLGCLSLTTIYFVLLCTHVYVFVGRSRSERYSRTSWASR